MDTPFHEIERIERPSPQMFRRNYVSRNRPVIITGVADRWKATSLWTPEYFKASFAGIKVMYKTWESDETNTDPDRYLKTFKVQDVLLGDFIDMALSANSAKAKFYLSQFPIFGAIPQLWGDIGSIKPYMGIPRYYRFRSKLGIVLEPSIWLAPPGATSVLHFDSYENLFVQIYGRKRFILISPSQSGSVYYPHYEFAKLHFSPVDVEHPDLTRFPLLKNVTALNFVVEPGEILFIPVRWWHYARSLDTSIAINFWWRLARTVIHCRYHTYIKSRRKVLDKLKEYGFDLGKNLQY